MGEEVGELGEKVGFGYVHHDDFVAIELKKEGGGDDDAGAGV
jgi:hypothetical protein